MSSERQGQTITKEKIEVKKPSMYTIVIFNDDYTTMEFVIEVLNVFFKKDKMESTAIMLEIHERGKSSVGIFTKEVAESKVDKITRHARKMGHPLRCQFEPCHK